MNLEDALKQFEIVEANLVKLDAVWARLHKIIPEGIVFFGGSREAREYRQLSRDWDRLIQSLPKIDGWSMTATPEDLDVIAQNRLDACEIDEISAIMSVEEGVELPGGQLDEYRSRFTAKRQQLVRDRIAEILAEIDSLLQIRITDTSGLDSQALVKNEDWERLQNLVGEVDRLLGAGGRSKHWDNLYRHLHVALRCDLEDIASTDWPSVKAELLAAGYHDTEPLPVQIADLGEVVATRPVGPVGTALQWSRLDAEDFERLLFAIISDAGGYENPEWLMRTNASDRGRDLSMWRVRDDSLAGTLRDRILIQCKHWLSRSVTDTDIAEALVRVTHWEPPPIQELVIATSGRFTADAVRWVEQHNHAAKRPTVLLWPESHLERLLAQRPYIAAAFKLR